ncbi:MAG: HD domain-containing protein [Chloroflexota bacterium]
MRATPPLPSAIAGIAVPADEVSEAVWVWAHRSLPQYLLAHSIRAYCWGATIGAGEGLAFDQTILWTASLMHDVGLTRIPTNERCFEVEGGEVARRFLLRHGERREKAETVATAIVLHMAPAVTLDDGAEAFLLDRATGLDVRGAEFDLVDAARPEVMQAFPRGSFDRHFLAAIRHEVAVRPGCQSTRLLHHVDLAAWMAKSPWRHPEG